MNRLGFPRAMQSPEFYGTSGAQCRLAVGTGLLQRECVVDQQTKHEITLVTLATLAPIPLITAAVVAILIS